MTKPIKIKKNHDGSYEVMVGNKVVSPSVQPEELLRLLEDIEDEQIQR